jgi:hypothetical protein
MIIIASLYNAMISKCKFVMSLLETSGVPFQDSLNNFSFSHRPQSEWQFSSYDISLLIWDGRGTGSG